VLLAAVTFAAETGADRHAWQLPCVMRAYLAMQGYLHEAVTVMGSAAAAATRLDDPLGQAVSLRALGNACVHIGDHDQARAHLERCLPLYQRLGDRRGEAWAQQNLSVLAEAEGRYADALGHDEKALRLFQAIGMRLERPKCSTASAGAMLFLAITSAPGGFCEQSLALITKLGGGDFEYRVWDTLGYTEFHLGDFARAAAHFEFALGQCRDYGDRFGEAVILTHVGDARQAVGELPQARQAWQQALTIYKDLEHADADKVRANLASTAD
jgi:tetratricopeptide (TPR) repeat protein